MVSSTQALIVTTYPPYSVIQLLRSLGFPEAESQVFTAKNLTKGRRLANTSAITFGVNMDFQSHLTRLLGKTVTIPPHSINCSDEFSVMLQHNR
jgi:hypothetical protein